MKRVGPIKCFGSVPTQREPENQPGGHLRKSLVIPSTVTFEDGTTLRDIHRVILCTGYHCSYPFLRSLHNDSLTPSSATTTVLVTDGTQMHNLHKDIFYIPDPTLSFVGVPYYTATFTLFEFQAIVVAAVYARLATLPSEEAMRAEYEQRVQRKGYGRAFHSLREEEVQYVEELIGWVNRDGIRQGLPAVEGHTAEWLKARAKLTEKLKEMRRAGRRDAFGR